MPAFKNHICLVSDQNAAELIGALLPDYGASRLHAIVSPQIKRAARNLQAACVNHDIGFTPYSVEHLPM